MSKYATLIASCAAFALAALPLSPTARATEDDFYNGKTVSLIIPIGPGGTYDLFARVVSRHLGKYIPGNPTIVPRNMPGGGGVVATNYTFNVAPHDGTTLIIITSTFAIEQLLGAPQIRYQARKFEAIGRLTDTTSTVAYWHTSGIKTANDLLTKPNVAAVSSLNEIFAARFVVMNRLLGAKIKLVPGYPSSRDYAIAAKRNEVGGFWIPYITLQNFYPDDLKEGRLNVVVQSTTSRDPALPNVPTMLELSNDDRAKQLFRHLASNDEIGRSLFTAPGIPAAQLKLLRTAFQKMLADPAFKAEAQKLNLPLSPKSAEEVQEIVSKTFETSSEVLDELKDLMKQR